MVSVYIFFSRAQILPCIAIKAKSDGDIGLRRMTFCRMVVIHISALHLRSDQFIASFFCIWLAEIGKYRVCIFYLHSHAQNTYRVNIHLHLPLFTPSVKFTFSIFYIRMWKYIGNVSDSNYNPVDTNLDRNI